MESLLGPNWREAPTEEKLDLLPDLWRQLRGDFARPAPSYPIVELHDVHAHVMNSFPEEQRMVHAILEVVFDTTSPEGESTP